ncbi:EAL domain-containing protein, partial [Rhodovulum iodosum]
AAGPGPIRAYRPSMHRAGAARHETERTLAAALEAGEIRPWYQPQLSTDTGRLTGVEALTRWHHPERGVLCPDDFLPALVEAGLAERLAEEIRFQSFSALAAWDRAGIDVPRVAVNFTAEDLGAPDLADRIAWELDRFDLAPSRLTVEILESVIAAPGDEAVARSIAALADLGCAIDLDDFGTGHASLAALGRFAIGRIKIDRSFVAGIDTARPRQDMVAAILGLADRLGLDTLGEGVETLGENAALAQLGCGHVQGHAIAPPLPFAEMLAWTMKHREKLARSTLGAPRAPPPCGGKTA